MASIQNKVIHRFIRPIEDYMIGGNYYTQIIPVDTQAYAYYSEESNSDQIGLWYVLGDGNHTYMEIKEGKGDVESSKEYPVITSTTLELINQKANKSDVYTKDEVDQLLADLSTFHIEIVEELPKIGEENVLYLVPDKDSEETEENYYYEYLWANNKWELIGNTGGGSIDPKDLVAEKIKYNYGTITNVQQALDLLMSYQPTIEPGEDEVEEIGSVIKDVHLSWEINKPMASITIQPGDIQVDPTAKEYTIKDANLDETTTYTIYFNDGKNTYTTEQTFTFASKLYNGTSAEENPNNEEILNFDQTFEVSDEPAIYNFNCFGGKYFFICLTEDRANKVVFKINGFIYTDFVETRKEFTNASGYTTIYSIFRSKNLQHANNIPVEISYNDN